MTEEKRRRVIKVIDGKMVMVDEDTSVLTPESLSPQEEIQRIEQAKSNIKLLPVPAYVPESARSQVERMIEQHCQQVMAKAVEEWKQLPDRSVEALVKKYEQKLGHSFLLADTLRPATDPTFITENTFAVTNGDIEVKNVVNCTGGILQAGELSVGFHVLGFAKVEGDPDKAIDDDSLQRIAENIRDMVSLLDKAPDKVVIHASTLGKQIGNLDQGHQYVKEQLERALTERFPERYPTPADVVIEEVRSLNYSTKKEQ
jgi:hypothetical protein